MSGKGDTRGVRNVETLESRGKTVYSLVLSLLWHFRHFAGMAPLSPLYGGTQIATWRQEEEGAIQGQSFRSGTAKIISWRCLALNRYIAPQYKRPI